MYVCVCVCILSDSKSPRVTRTLLHILADLTTAAVFMVHLIFNSSNHLSKLLGTVSKKVMISCNLFII